MAVRDGAATVKQAIDSILGQSLDDLELIVVDDGSKDRTVVEIEAVADRRMRIVCLPSPRGPSEARNEGILRSRAPYLAIADADDISVPHRLERQILHLDKHPHITALGSQMHHFGPWGGPVHHMKFPTASEEILARFERGHMALAHPTVMFRRSLLESVGLYFSECLRAQDLQLLLRASGSGVMEALSDSLVDYRTDTWAPSWSYWRRSAAFRRYAVYSAGRHRLGLTAMSYHRFSNRLTTRAVRCLDPLVYVRGTAPSYLRSQVRLK